MQRFSLMDTPLTGMNLIEASAGTGKTYTITGLYIRLILEQGLSVDQILVVTYTKAATAELRERIRSRMVELKRTYETGQEDELSTALLWQSADVKSRLQRLNLAILSFDQAAIYTIHGFCQRVLTQSAFESGMPFQTEMLLDERPLIQEIVDDFWRVQVQDLPSGLQRYLLRKSFSPDQLTAGLRGKLNKPYLEIKGCSKPEGLTSLELSFKSVFELMREQWLTSRDEIVQLLKSAEGLSRSKYRVASIDKWALALDLFLQSGAGPRFKELEKFSASVLADSLKKAGVAPHHELFDLCDQLIPKLDALEQQYEQARIALLGDLLNYVNHELPLRKQQIRHQSYDDLLLNLDKALSGDRADQLIQAVRRTYKSALIDEFQDTDPIQFESFRRLLLFEGGSLFLVGDPKQAIYSFRGADIFAYLKARDNASSCFTLDVNWRSVPSLIQVVNSLFEQPHNGFVFPQIPFQPSFPAEKSHPILKIVPSDERSFNIGFIPGKSSKDQAALAATAWTADEIARLIKLGRNNQAQIGDRPLAGGDIAVLVRSHRQGVMIRDALAERGVHSVQRSQQDVFKSQESVEVERVLLAIHEPQNEGLLLAALATDLIGVSGEVICRLAEEESKLSGYLDQFHDYHQIWLQQGFMRMFRHLVGEQQVVERLLERVEGERRLTNILHIAELLHQQERATTAGMETLCHWLNQLRLGERPEDEASQLRLESDDNLVQIVTIHKSKGLQYPVVFVPFVWDGGVRATGTGEACSYHDPDQDYQAILDLGSSDWSAAKSYESIEALAESMRLLYVALTRAQHRCYMTWGQINGAGESPFAWLLHPPCNQSSDLSIDQLASHFKTLSEADLLARLEQWVGQLDSAAKIDIIGTSETTENISEELVISQQQSLDFEILHARKFTRKLSRGHAVTSFSALASGHEHFERPDHDASQLSSVDGDDLVPRRDRYSFPRGANPGSCLHGIFENLDFSKHNSQELKQLVYQQLELYGIDRIWQAVACRMIEDVLATELEPDTGLSLRRLDMKQCLVEMEFSYPVTHLNVGKLSSLLLQHGLNESEEMDQAIHRLRFADVQGYLKGFIDLIFEFDGRYYLLDYKSNWLGDQQRDYAASSLDRAMAREGYFLQYLLYAVALHRYLARRVSDYEYDKHFGSVYYLFLRGIAPETGSSYGVYKKRPSRELIESLDAYFASAEGVIQ